MAIVLQHDNLLDILPDVSFFNRYTIIVYLLTIIANCMYSTYDRGTVAFIYPCCVYLKPNIFNKLCTLTYIPDNNVNGATFLLLEKDDLKEIVKSVGTVKQLQQLQSQLLETTVSIFLSP